MQVMYDASGVRLHAGRQASVLNMIITELPPDHPVSDTRPLRDSLGHTPLQVSCRGHHPPPPDRLLSLCACTLHASAVACTCSHMLSLLCSAQLRTRSPLKTAVATSHTIHDQMGTSGEHKELCQVPEVGI